MFNLMVTFTALGQLGPRLACAKSPMLSKLGTSAASPQAALWLEEVSDQAGAASAAPPAATLAVMQATAAIFLSIVLLKPCSSRCDQKKSKPQGYSFLRLVDIFVSTLALEINKIKKNY
ncbi:hypothetical protein [Actinopolyspora mzabensis]|uniref:hypothetical protein n=1 Tax=Actinopolyspora mzabensis TaxID=995066 RepID=UPI00115F8596|nr:hypothetical protein [Actinopolyspora mzabensis]